MGRVRIRGRTTVRVKSRTGITFLVINSTDCVNSEMLVVEMSVEELSAVEVSVRRLKQYLNSIYLSSKVVKDPFPNPVTMKSTTKAFTESIKSAHFDVAVHCSDLIGLLK